MNVYKVNFGEYSLTHFYTYTYFDNFTFNGKKYYIGSHVKLTEKGMSEMYRNGRYDYNKGDFRLVGHYINDKKKEEWEYIIGWWGQGLPIVYTTQTKPEELISAVLSSEIDESMHTPGKLQVDFISPNYSPKDWEVPGVMLGWVIFIIVWICAFIFKDWWFRLIIQIVASFYFGSWREKKINEAITTQKFKE